MVVMAVFIAVMMVMTVVPVLGYIPLGFMNATIIHIPVLVGAILLGPKKGAALGFFFGLTSMWKNTALMPNLTSFVFTPFICSTLLHRSFLIYEGGITPSSLFPFLLGAIWPN